eukprot:220068-Pelagomonas_calceolata.AAC.1
MPGRWHHPRWKGSSIKTKLEFNKVGITVLGRDLRRINVTQWAGLPGIDCTNPASGQPLVQGREASIIRNKAVRDSS